MLITQHEGHSHEVELNSLMQFIEGELESDGLLPVCQPA